MLTESYQEIIYKDDIQQIVEFLDSKNNENEFKITVFESGLSPIKYNEVELMDMGLFSAFYKYCDLLFNSNMELAIKKIKQTAELEKNGYSKISQEVVNIQKFIFENSVGDIKKIVDYCYSNGYHPYSLLVSSLFVLAVVKNAFSQ